MALLRTKQLYAGQLSGAGARTVLYTVPAGYRAVVRDIRFTPRAVGSGTTTQVIISVSGALLILTTSNPTVGSSGSWTGNLVLHQAQQLEVYTEHAQVDVLVSGAELPMETSSPR